jgi:ubiquitin C-terminal hydrolase
LGNTCYVNAILQVLVGVPDIKIVLAGSTALTAGSGESCLLLPLRELMDIMSSPLGDESTAVSPTALVDSLFHRDSKWVTKYNAKKGQQHSADEFLQCLLEEVPELQQLVAFDMQDVNKVVQTSSILHVELVPHAGKLPLSALIHAQFISKDMPLSNFTRLLIVVVKRWRTGKRWRNEENGNISRDSTEILLSDPLELYDTGGKNIAQFSLSGFVYHEGRSPTGGHYTAFSQRTINDEVKWLLFDDDKQPEEYGEEQIKIKVIITCATVSH